VIGISWNGLARFSTPSQLGPLSGRRRISRSTSLGCLAKYSATAGSSSMRATGGSSPDPDFPESLCGTTDVTVVLREPIVVTTVFNFGLPAEGLSAGGGLAFLSG